MQSTSLSLREYRLLYPCTASQPTLTQSGRLSRILATREAKRRLQIRWAEWRRDTLASLYHTITRPIALVSSALASLGNPLSVFRAAKHLITLVTAPSHEAAPSRTMLLGKA